MVTAGTGLGSFTTLTTTVCLYKNEAYNSAEDVSGEPDFTANEVSRTNKYEAFFQSLLDDEDGVSGASFSRQKEITNCFFQKDSKKVLQFVSTESNTCYPLRCTIAIDGKPLQVMYNGAYFCWGRSDRSGLEAEMFEGKIMIDPQKLRDVFKSALKEINKPADRKVCPTAACANWFPGLGFMFPLLGSLCGVLIGTMMVRIVMTGGWSGPSSNTGLAHAGLGGGYGGYATTQLSLPANASNANATVMYDSGDWTSSVLPQLSDITGGSLYDNMATPDSTNRNSTVVGNGTSLWHRFTTAIMPNAFSKEAPPPMQTMSSGDGGFALTSASSTRQRTTTGATITTAGSSSTRQRTTTGATTTTAGSSSTRQRTTTGATTTTAGSSSTRQRTTTGAVTATPPEQHITVGDESDVSNVVDRQRSDTGSIDTRSRRLQGAAAQGNSVTARTQRSTSTTTPTTTTRQHDIHWKNQISEPNPRSSRRGDID